jgi:hypothetical protein
MIQRACAAAILLIGASVVHAQPEPSGETPSTEPTGDAAAQPEPSAQPDTPAQPESPAADNQTSGAEGVTDDDSETAGSGSLIEEDVVPTLSVVSNQDLEVRVGGLVQVHAVPYVGDDALVENGDPATRPGFRLRRSRIGFEGRLFREPLRIQLVIDLLEDQEDVGSVSDAKIVYDYTPQLRFALGAGKVPFARGSLESSRHLASIERPLSVSLIAPDRRLGATVEGEVLDSRLAYLVGFLNGTEGFADGNEFGGFLSGGRLQYTVLGQPRGLSVEEGVAVGVSGYYEDAPATNGFALAADVLVAFSGASLTIEGLCDTRKPDDSPEVAPTIADEITRCGAYATVLYQLPNLPLEPAARVEMVDDNRDLEDAGDAWLASIGVNSEVLDPYLRAQLHYISRIERHGPARANESIVLSVTGSF